MSHHIWLIELRYEGKWFPDLEHGAFESKKDAEEYLKAEIIDPNGNVRAARYARVQ